MFSIIKNKLNNMNSKTNNENGNILVVAIIIITVLSFSVATIAGMSVNLANDTTNAMENLNDESEAKANIRLAINFFEDWIKDPLNNGDFDQFDTEYENQPNKIFGVTVLNDTSSFPELESTGFAVAKAYKFSVLLSDNRTLVMYDFVSDVGVQTTYFEPFEYTIGTSADLVINSGFFGSDNYGSPDPLKMFGENIYFARRAPYIVDGTTNNQELTSFDISRNTVLTDYSLSPAVAAQINYNNDLKYCGSDLCFTLNDNGDPMILNAKKETDNPYSDFAAGAPTDQGTSGEVLITDFFGDWDYIEYIMEFIRKEAPSGSAPTNGSNDIEADWDNLAYDIFDNSDTISVRTTGPWWKPNTKITWPNSEFVDITEDIDLINFRTGIPNNTSLVYFGPDTSGFFPYNHSYFDYVASEPLHIDSDINISIEGSLIVFGDLYLDGDWGTQDILGEIVVTGDLYIEGTDKDWEGSLMVFGETFIELDNEAQFQTYGQNSGITFMCKDNIHFISHDENHNDSDQSNIFYMFIYTEESIYIDAVNSRYNYSGVMFARGLGDSKRTNPDDYMMTDHLGNPIRGIVINSFYGHVDSSGGYHDGDDIVDSFRFNIDIMSSSSYANKFENLPDFPSEVIVSTGDLNFYASEFTYE